MIAKFLSIIKSINRSYKILAVMLIDFIIVLLSLNLGSYFINNKYYFEGYLFEEYRALALIILLIIIISSLITDTSRVVIRAIDINSLHKFFYHSLATTVLLIFILDFLDLDSEDSFRLFFIFFFVFFFLTTSFRIFSGYILNNYDLTITDIKNIALFGAGSAGKNLYNSQLYTKNKIIAFVDDNINLANTSVFGIDVLNRKEFEKFAKEKRIDEIWIGIADIKYEEKKSIVNFAAKFTNKIKSIPSLNKLIENYNLNENLMEVDLNHYLGRTNIDISSHDYKNIYSGKKILITGAGGSIGSQLTKTVIDTMPSSIILLDSNELALYNLEKKLSSKFVTNLTFVLGNATDYKFVKSVVHDYNIDIILHAAAYKHVPLVENNIIQSLKNNVISTKNIVKASLEENIERLVLVSSDKAVRPTNIMGVSKRLSELYLKLYHSKSNINTSIVRFGNVLGSSGSVIPLFQNQIMSGGPITITDVNMTRYFMSIEEASQLILISGKFGVNAETFLLDMGEEIKIIDLAKNMIKMANLSIKDDDNPKGDIEIVITDKRPGEKLFEELLIDHKSKKTAHSKVMISDEDIKDHEKLVNCINDFEKIIGLNSEVEIENFLTEYKSLIGYEKN